MKAVASMSRKGNGWDDAVAEATLGTIEAERFHAPIPTDLTAVRRAPFPSIEAHDNRVRLHSTLGYETPNQVHRQTTARGPRAA